MKQRINYLTNLSHRVAFKPQASILLEVDPSPSSELRATSAQTTTTPITHFLPPEGYNNNKHIMFVLYKRRKKYNEIQLTINKINLKNQEKNKNSLHKMYNKQNINYTVACNC